jgi:hypothetical protein
MPPQQADGLPDFVDDYVHFGSHIRPFPLDAVDCPVPAETGTDNSHSAKSSKASKDGNRRFPGYQYNPPVPEMTALLACGDVLRIWSPVM